MKIQLLSDLHNEFLRGGKKHADNKWQGFIPDTDADIIILAGDIDTGTNGVEWAVSESKRLAKNIIYVVGNHEFYRHEYFSVKANIAKLCEGTIVHCLDSAVYFQDDVRFIGTTLWTNYQADISVPQDLAMLTIDNCLSDHRVIKFRSGDDDGRFRPEHALALHRKELAWLVRELSNDYQGKTVVVTHHGPHPVCQHPDFSVSAMSAAFHSDLSALLAEHDIDVWAFGHTHANVDEVVSGTRIVSNQAGYPGEQVTDFDAKFLIDL